MKKFLCALTALLMALSLAACKEDAALQPVETANSVGSLLLAGETCLTMYYNKDGKVISIADNSGNAVYTQLNGKTCLKALTHLLTKADPPVAVSSLLLKQSKDALTPKDDFLQVLAAEAERILGKVVTVCPTEDQDENGYFSPETANAVLSAYLGNPADATYLSTSEPVDGYYQITCTVDGTSENYTVSAFYGTVTLYSEFIGEPDIQVDTADSFVDNSTNITENPDA